MTEIIHTIEVKIEIENGSGNRIKWFTQGLYYRHMIWMTCLVYECMGVIIRRPSCHWNLEEGNAEKHCQIRPHRIFVKQQFACIIL